MILSDHIARLIEEMLEEGGGSTEVRRNDLAAKIGCVPSQINYVITSRFTPERGYVTESRRGGGGYIRIVRIKMTKNEYLMHFFQAIGQTLDEAEAKAYLKNLIEHGIMTEREARIAAQAMSQSALDKCPADKRAMVRADILRHILMLLMME
ncbi:MAG: CtsR family transcriptional regulator [Thermoguttaceae bacterium]|nr:CtsR family transcriptional regulator [Thermoguttaceae bacterium]